MNEALEAELRVLHERVCKAISDPKRLLIISVLRDGELTQTLDVNQSNASQHLAVLRERGIVTARRAGTSVYYSLRSQKILTAIDLMREFVAEEAGQPLERSGRRLSGVSSG